MTGIYSYEEFHIYVSDHNAYHLGELVLTVLHRADQGVCTRITKLKHMLRCSITDYLLSL